MTIPENDKTPSAQLLEDVRLGLEQIDRGQCAPLDEAMIDRIKASGRQMLKEQKAKPPSEV
jgi:hypothetical protein